MKRKIYAMLTVGLLFGSASVFAQKDNVGIGTTTPDASAVLDIQSSNKGLLIPRMSLDQRKSVNRPATGLMIYQTDEKAGFYFYNGDDWKPLTEAVGNAKAVALDVDNWSKNGDAVSGTNFLGTTNNQPLRFKINNIAAGMISTSSVFIGNQAGLVNVGIDNVGIGVSALKSNLGGVSNIAFGKSALLTNTAGSNNIAFGTNALILNTASDNFAMGSFVLKTNTSGTENIGIGKSSLEFLSSGNANLAIGIGSQRQLITGSFNVSIGRDALRTATNSSRSTGIGYHAGRNSTGSDNVFLGYQSGMNELGSGKLYISNTNSPNPLIKGDFAANNLQVNSKTTGYLAIGDFSTATSASPGMGGLPLPANIGQASGYRLVVQDGILCEKVKVALRATGSTDWADYVFEPEYKTKMMSLENLEKYIHTNKHLPNVPSTAEVQKEGLDFHETSRMFMEKIEELTLYMIDMKKEINALKAENEALKAKK
jgi:hypothetical protein